ncbi:hypothetical protein ACIRU3_45010 [Streptomyces sp. NPDC101151]|uniref:hypothetical protein n=1 Tax=Streptomyces sp. NPDC101151 TaxID=3366115 RepID=UPI0037F9157C
MMKERVSGSRYVDRPRVERTTALAETLRGLGKERAIVFLAIVLYNAPNQLIAERLQLQPDLVSRIFSKTVSVLRHPSRALALADYAYEIDAFDPTILIDDELRSLIREWRIEEMFEQACEQCGGPMPIPWSASGQSRTGRPRQYCANACRQKAYRMRHR